MQVYFVSDKRETRNLHLTTEPPLLSDGTKRNPSLFVFRRPTTKLSCMEVTWFTLVPYAPSHLHNHVFAYNSINITWADNAGFILNVLPKSIGSETTKSALPTVLSVQLVIFQHWSDALLVSTPLSNRTRVTFYLHLWFVERYFGTVSSHNSYTSQCPFV